MKKILYLIILVTGITNAQIVNIPDANFKAKLLSADNTNTVAKNLAGNYFKIDANSDGQIQTIEALEVSYLDVSSSNITTLTGIESFTNVQFFLCTNNQITSLNMSSNLSLVYLNCSTNQLTSLNVNSNAALSELYCYYNQLTSLNVNSNTALSKLDCSSNQLASLNVNNNTGLYILGCFSNHLTSLNVTNNTLLQSLNCNTNQLTSLNVNNNTGLISLECGNNQLTSINVNNNTALTSFICASNLLTSLNVSNNTLLNNFWCYSNQLSSINVNNNTALTYFICRANNLTTLDVSHNLVLNNLDCSNNQLISLNLIHNTALTQVICSNNVLTSLYLKNGVNESLYFTNNPNLQFICADDSQVATIQSDLNLYGMNACVLNSYCSFTPGGNYNTITGVVKFDHNNNGCDASDLPQPHIRININDGTNTGATFTTNSGNYIFYTPAGNFNLTPDIENPTWFSFSPSTASLSFPDANNNVSTQNFCVFPNGVHNDLEVVIEPITSARPGFNATYKIVYKNKGNQMLSGDVSFTFDDTVLDFVSATTPTNSQNIGVLNWSYANLLPFENRSFYITLHVNATTATPPVNIGDVLSFNAIITPIIGDDIPADNTFYYKQIVIGSLDPNNITCLEGAVVPPSQIGSYLHYGVNFENTGTYQAENVVVKVVIDTTKYDVNSLQLLNTSNPAYVKITGNVVEFIFQNINLAATSGTPPVGGHGDVLFKIKTLNTLTTGDIVGKTADIFFDYNAPVNTGMANTTFQLLNNNQFVIDNSIVVSPNPTSSIINIKGNSAIKLVELYDVQGRILAAKTEDNTSINIDLSDKQNGIYFVKITTDNGSKVEKIVKQ